MNTPRTTLPEVQQVGAIWGYPSCCQHSGEGSPCRV